MREVISEKNKDDFLYIVSLINKSKESALISVNQELINLYWNVGKYISEKIKMTEWGEGIINNLADYISLKNPEIKGFTSRGLFRMRQFYENYYFNPKVSALLTQLSWTNHLLILSKTKSMEEKEYYMLLSIRERYSSRELERQIDSGIFERTMLSKKISPIKTQLSKEIISVFKDTYVLDFLDLPINYSEKDLRMG
ncbi:MAG: DUF1016 N-terminal domain-containing protein [Nanoarchaeota archaeon]